MVEIVGCVVADGMEEALAVMDKSDNSKRIDLFELRVDAFDSQKLKNVGNKIGLLKGYSSRLIITIRKKEEGGFQDIREEERFDLFKRFLDIKPLFIDVELSASFVEEIITLARKKKVRVILSYHNLNQTPSYDELLPLYQVMSKLNPDLIKIIAYAKGMKDNISIIRLYENLDNLVAFCMGDEGRLSRLFSLCFSPLAYFSIGKPSAKGQFSVQEVDILKRILGVNND